MTKLGFYVNMEVCTGCRTCQVTCKEKNRLPIGEVFRHVATYETGEYPHPGHFHYSGSCNHCENPACVENCPTGAMYIDSKDGTVQHDDEACIGCRMCVMSCPYGIPQFSESDGVVHKCNFCRDLPEDEQPVCVAACPQFALEYGDIDELKAKHPDAVVDLPFLYPSSATSPKRIITPREAALNEDATQKNL